MIEIAQLNCCTTPLSDVDVISQHDAETMADLLKAVADPMRLRIISIISSLGGADVCACEFPDRLGISQPTASHHLKRLTEAGLLTREQRGKWAYFSLVPERLETISGFLRTPLPRS
ncbi:MAG: metalloregulator ArsR/SmtB family transcription factor [Thermomicrobiales bacterium]|nr:metalloregulator ArsR/SmtB family transcription factor [Thermomicrobiales bacterium]